MRVDKKDLRKSKDWVGDSWTDIEAKPEICSFITAAVTLESKLSTIPNNIKPDVSAAIRGVDLIAGSEPSSAEEVSPNFALVTAVCLPNVKENGNDVPPLKEEGNESVDDADKVDDTQVRINVENESHAKADNVQVNEENSIIIIESTKPLGENCKNVQVAEIAT